MAKFHLYYLWLVLVLTGSSLRAQTDGPHAVDGTRKYELLSGVTQSKRAPRGKKIDTTAMAQQNVLVKEASGAPISGASVMPYALRVIERSGHGFWDEAKLGRPEAVISNEQGMATFRFPQHIDAFPDVLTTRRVSFHVRHPEFVEQAVHFDLGPAVAEVTLEPGCDVQFSAVDEQGAPVTDFGVLMSGHFSSSQWTSDGQGGKRTGSVKDGKWQTLLVKLQADAPTLFSNVLPLSVRPNQAVKIRNVTLSPGARIVGRLSENVPRPIMNGRVITVVVPRPAASSYAREDPSLVWHTSADVGELGDFELPSVPGGGEIQIIAQCDGWISQTTMEGSSDFFVMGQLFVVKEKQVSVAVRMERTGTLEVSVATPDGQPLEGVIVKTWPRQLYYKGDSGMLGEQIHSWMSVANQLLSVEEHIVPTEFSDVKRFTATTDQDGKATIQGIPIGRTQSLTVTHPRFCLPMKEGERTQSYSISSPVVQRLRIVVEEAFPVEFEAQ